MQARSFLTALAATVLSLVLVTTGLLWGLERRSPLHLVDQPLPGGGAIASASRGAGWNASVA
jgi:hypothetical protein